MYSIQYRLFLENKRVLRSIAFSHFRSRVWIFFLNFRTEIYVNKSSPKFQTSVLAISQNMNRPSGVAPITVLGHSKGRHDENFKIFIFYSHIDSLIIKH